MKNTLRRLVLFSMLISVVISATPSALAQAELITNGGFETGDFSGWTSLDFVTSDHSHSGSYSAAKYFGYTVQEFSPAVTATGDLTFHWYEKYASAPNGYVLVGIRYDGEDWAETTKTGVIVTDGVNPSTWFKYTATVDTTKAITGIRIGRGTEGEGYIDDLSLPGEDECNECLGTCYLYSGVCGEGNSIENVTCRECLVTGINGVVGESWENNPCPVSACGCTCDSMCWTECPECCDGIDNDGVDGADWPTDPKCGCCIDGNETDGTDPCPQPCVPELPTIALGAIGILGVALLARNRE